MDLTIAHAYRPLWWWVNNDTPPYRYYAYSGGRASGKSTSIAQSLVCRAATKPIRILCAREYQNSIADSVHRLLSDQINKLGLQGYTVTREDVTHINGSTFIFRGLHNNLDSIKSIEGLDVCWVEEAQTLSAMSLDILIPTIRKPASTLIFSWNPRTESDPVWDKMVAHPVEPDRTLHWHTTWRDVRPLLNTDMLQLIDASRHMPEYPHIWEGKPLTASINTVIAYTDLDQATQRTPDLMGGVTFGVDVARYGNDRTALAIKTGNTISGLHTWAHASITDTAQRVQTFAAQHQPIMINVDDTGVGGGLTDILAQQGLPVCGINYAATPKQRDKYPNIASELWFDFAELLPSLTITPDLAHLAELLQELSTREWTINKRNQRQVQAKQAYKDSQAARSPDLADAVMLACYQPARLPDWDVEI